MDNYRSYYLLVWFAQVLKLISGICTEFDTSWDTCFLVYCRTHGRVVAPLGMVRMHCNLARLLGSVISSWNEEEESKL